MFSKGMGEILRGVIPVTETINNTLATITICGIGISLFCIGEGYYRENQKMRGQLDSVSLQLQYTEEALAIANRQRNLLHRNLSDIPLEKEIIALKKELAEVKEDRDSAIKYYQQQLKIADSAYDRLIQRLNQPLAPSVPPEIAK